MGRRASGSARYSGELAARAAGKGMAASIGQYTPVSLPGEPHGQRRLADRSPQGRKELDTTEATLRA